MHEPPRPLPEETVEPTRRAATAALILGVALAWPAVVFGPSGMGQGLGVFVVTWTVMMIAMMLPSAAPFILLFSRGATRSQTAELVGGYLLVWAAAGVPAYFAHALPMSVGPVSLALAGIYQLSPVKDACLEHCRSPGDFLVQRWGQGALRLGLEHGLWCLGCCWGLMLVLVLVGAMGLPWVVGIAGIVALEKLTRHGQAWARLGGVVLLLAAILHGWRLWTGSSMDMS